MDIVLQTRFSFFGQSGRQAAAATDPERLFDRERLDARFRYFEMITLPSLVGQSDPDFTHMVLSSTRMPNPYKRLMREMVHDTLGSSRARVMFRPEGSAGDYFRGAMAKAYGNSPCAQVVLDDDDALARDFIKVLRSLGEAALALPHREADYLFLSFARGHTLIIEDGVPTSLRRRHVPYTNLGLTLIAPGDVRRSPFTTNHRKIGLRHPSMLITGSQPYYIRTFHGQNDSKADKRGLPLTDDEMSTALGQFPFLASHFAPEQHRLAA